MKAKVASGATLAASAAALLLAGAVSAPSVSADDQAAKEGHCVGANACKGHSACKTATSACAGKNACKGKGFTMTTKEECDKIEGAKFEPVEG